jgi:hypothetical protein
LKKEALQILCCLLTSSNLFSFGWNSIHKVRKWIFFFCFYWLMGLLWLDRCLTELWTAKRRFWAQIKDNNKKK